MLDDDDPDADSATPFNVPGSLRRRRAAANHLAPLGDGSRDPWAPGPARRPSSYGLSPEELRSEANRQAADGWPLPDIMATLGIQLRRTCPCSHTCPRCR